jgi:hypothetical protein
MRGGLWSFRTAKTQSGHEPRENPAMQRSPGVPHAIVWVAAQEGSQQSHTSIQNNCTILCDYSGLDCLTGADGTTGT